MLVYNKLLPLKNNLSSIILIFILSGASCKKHIDTGKATPHITNPTSYILKRMIMSGPQTNGESFLFIYNKDNLVSEIQRYQWGTSSINGGPTQTWYDTSYSTFEYQRGLCTKWSVDKPGRGYFVLKYNDKNLPVSRTSYYSDNRFYAHNSYTYDGAGNLIERKDSTDKTNFLFVFSYNNSNNLISATDYILWPNPQQKMKYEWLSFDNKVNFIKAVNGLPPSFVWENNYSSYSSSSPNNYLSVNFYSPVNVDQPFGQPYFYSASYEYNDEGLPVKMFSGSWITTFEYEKFR